MGTPSQTYLVPRLSARWGAAERGEGVETQPPQEQNTLHVDIRVDRAGLVANGGPLSL